MLPCSPVDLLDLDLATFDALVEQVDAREREWTRRDEMAAVQIDMLHVLYRTIITVNSAKKVRVPEFRFPRPGDGDDGGDRDRGEAKVVRHTDMLALMGGAA